MKLINWRSLARARGPHGPHTCAMRNTLLQVSNWDVEIKSDNSPLTRADKDANAIICSALQRISPHIPIISEENKLVAYEIRKVNLMCAAVLPACHQLFAGPGQCAPPVAAVCGGGGWKVCVGGGTHDAKRPACSPPAPDRLVRRLCIPSCTGARSLIVCSNSVAVDCIKYINTVLLDRRSTSTFGWWTRWTAPRSS